MKEKPSYEELEEKVKKLESKVEILKGERVVGDIYSGLPLLICVYNYDFIVTYTNEEYDDYFNLEKGAIIGETFFDLIAEEDREIVRNKYPIK